ncbi:hypothetical protein KSS87_014284 [Heliosperma pusillum]|nr:hypothetical protein KSS87_014284 [Heliosperma pusillum]
MLEMYYGEICGSSERGLLDLCCWKTVFVGGNEKGRTFGRWSLASTSGLDVSVGCC